ncbi:uncharacterized protein LOC120273874 [Dioscorea cayenensis subsp. rotundata]|uniref:Uncharacterized protein LOC120273874 n=1 Tax=Dioscorea cayennensis subsp. rotundata TaxID=55577 RepID=A0AB40CCN8_DIOCR|nr:uncharacterized protein LOC120273874 [Dioscorea cayenensis subsp. rotundata]
MMMPSSQEAQQESLQSWQDNKFFTKLLSKESSLANPSFRVYYGVASGAVPFMWESQPGTPKNTMHTPTLPPLTPPPSYHSNLHNKKTTKKNSKGHSNLINTILPRLALKNKTQPSSPASSPLSSSSSSFNSSGKYPRRRQSCSTRLSFSSAGDEEDSDDIGRSPRSTLCFGMRHGAAGVIMKNALLCIVGHGSNQGSSSN